MTRSLIAFVSSLAAATLVGAALAARRVEVQPAQDRFDALVRPFLQRYCVDCHGAQMQKGGLRIDDLPPAFEDAANAAIWSEVLEKLSAGEMPPPRQPVRPSAEEAARIVECIAACVDEGLAARLARRERVSFRRLSREEYANTIRDLLGVQFDVADRAGLNADERWRGFERMGPVLTLSPSHLEKYLAAAEAILAEAYPAAAPPVRTARYSAVDLVGGSEVYSASAFAELHASGDAERIRVDLWPGQTLRVSPFAGAELPAGQYRLRLQLSGLAALNGRAPHLVLRAEAVDRQLLARDAVASEGEPRVVELDVHLPAGAHELSLTNDVRGPLLLGRLRRAGTRPFLSLAEGRIPWQVRLTDEDHRPLLPVLIVDWVEIEGPLEPDADHERQGYLPRASEGTDSIRPALARFAERAFRRPLRPGEVDGYVELALRELEAGADLVAAVKTSLTAVLCSADFLYLTEGAATDPDSGPARTLNPWELASRLSYFLWSTMPDGDLRARAADGSLLERSVLRSQVKRMLADPRAARFATSFARQWLQLDKVGLFAPDADLYPDYDAHLERSMVEETTAFFAELLAADGKLSELLDSDWTMLNARLARHYGIEDVAGDRLRRVALESADHRGGVLTHASVLSLTSDGTRHRPVHRGIWFAETIFGESAPPPPANVEPIEPNPPDAPKATVRMQLAAHSSAPSCAACHARTDPYGFAFENYDAIGRWRTEEVVPTGTGANPPVDASAVLPDGRAFSGVPEFRELLAEEFDRFHDAFVEKLATYALRRPMTVDDRAALARIREQSAAGGARLAHTVETLVLSDLFQAR